MKLRFVSSLALIGLVLSGCATESTSPTAANPAAKAAPAAARAPMGEPKANSAPVPGGFSPLAVTDAGATAAAKAVAAKIGGGWSFAELVSAQSQVVAGTNYELVAKFAKAGESRGATATVWRKLDGSLEVTNWKWEKKAEKAKTDKPKADKPKADKPKPDKPKGDKPKTDTPKPKKEPVAGGFSKLPTTDVGAIAAAKALETKIGGGWAYDGLLSAQSQVVAGTNYKVTARFAKGGQKKKASATVWKKLDGSREVTEWKWL